MRQEQIKEILERIRSNKNNATNELAATEEVATLNATNEATLSVASARGITTTTISVDNYLYLESYDGNGNAFEEPIIGNYSGTLYTLFGSVNMSSLLAANNLSASDLTACYLTLYGDGGDFSSLLQVDGHVHVVAVEGNPTARLVVAVTLQTIGQGGDALELVAFVYRLSGGDRLAS